MKSRRSPISKSTRRATGSIPTIRLTTGSVPRRLRSTVSRKALKSLLEVTMNVLRRYGSFFLFLACLAVVPVPRVSANSEARTVQYAETDIIAIHAKVRFSTLIVLPGNEEILDATTGDKEFWIINGAHNLCYLHPAQKGIRSNLNLITSAGHVYSFLLTEIS